ncbi:muscle M-line assembly protein unc-89 [Clonorchis sinensis]|uniref:Muscle M-line assembly protein unc-89 n=1 Tax=Clonorchis sinensis TaxID=79923 RepID=G7Y4Z4_CLOSI|nr:muscle M-line assembly protein unc-89 [Clonorchis sinensis]
MWAAHQCTHKHASLGYLNHIRLDDRISSDYRVGRVGAGVFELTIDRVQRNHAGLLECRAWNAYEVVSNKWEIVVAAVPRFSRFDWSLDVREFEVKHGDSWELRIPLEDWDCTQGHEWITKVWLERLTRIPAFTDTGKFPESLESRVRLRIIEGLRWVELVVDSISLADAGVYRLWIQNQAGRDYLDFRLRVADKPHVRPNKPRVLPHGPGTLVIYWDIPIPTSRLEAEIKYTGYRIEYRREQPGASWNFLGSTPAEQTQLLVRSPLEPEVTYRFRVCLENWHGYGPASEPSDPVQLPTHSITDVYDVMDEALPYADGSFESRYTVMEELARTKHAGLYRLVEKSTGRSYLAKIVDTSRGSTERLHASAFGHRSEQARRESLPPRPVSAMDTGRLMDRRVTSQLSLSRTSLTDSDEWRRQRTEQELKLLTKIQHGALAKFHEAYQDARRTVAIMEDVTAGGTLWHQLSHRITMTETKAAEILRQLLDLTNQLHRSGFVHLGLQPENIFFTDRTRKRVALAGLSQTQRIDEERPVRLTFRSAVYMPPELSSETPQQRRFGPASDLWSLGLLLYQMTTGDTEGPPEVTRMERLQLSPKMVKFTKRLLHPDPSKRPTAAEALRDPWLTSITTQMEPRPSITSLAGRQRLSGESLIDEDLSTHNVAESISKQAYTRLLRWIDASHAAEQDEREVEELISVRRRRHSQQYLREMETEVRESRKDIVVHAHVTARGQAPEILTPMGSVSVEEGGPAVLKCAVHLPRPRKTTTPLDRMSNLKIYWYLNGRELKLSEPTVKLTQPQRQHYMCTFDPDTGDVRLHIDEVTTYDAGTYEVRVVGQYGEVSDSANLRVYAAPHRPSSRIELQASEELGARILLPLVDVSAASGNRIQLKAKVAGIPLPRCTWLHNGVPLVASTRRRFYQEETGGLHSSELQLTLELVSLNTADSGLYTLVATNKHGSQSCSAVVDVLGTLNEDYEAPHFLVELTSTTVVEGSAARFESCVRGQPAPTVRWLKDGKPLLTDGIRLTVSQSSTERSTTNTTSHTLLVREALLRDSGTYTCIATSAAGTAITEAALHVRGLFNRGMPGGSESLGVRHRLPEFTRRLRNQQVVLGGNIRLAASVLAQPSATVIWQRNGVEINTNLEPRIMAKNQSGHLELVIENVTRDDLGQYTVIAYNAAGEARCSCVLSVLEEHQFRLPQFTRELRDHTVLEGNNIFLEAIATGEPPPDFKWEKDGFEILPDGIDAQRIVPSVNGLGHACLTITKARLSDAGLYRCIAHNRYGRERCTAFVYVEAIGRRGSTDRQALGTGLPLGRGRSLPPVGSGRLDVNSALVTPNSELKFVVNLTIIMGEMQFCILLITATWTKAGRTLTYDGRRRITRTKSGELSLTIDQVMTNDEGRYTLTLEPSDASAPKELEPITMCTRVDVDMKIRGSRHM